MTRAMAPVAAEIIARRPPTIAMVTAMVKEANRPMAGSTPAMIENEIASGIRARATTRPASTSVRQTFGSFSQSGRRTRRCAAGDSADEDKRAVTCRARAHPQRQGGMCGGRHGTSGGAPRSAVGGPEAGLRGPSARGRAEGPGQERSVTADRRRRAPWTRARVSPAGSDASPGAASAPARRRPGCGAHTAHDGGRPRADPSPPRTLP